MILYLEVVGFVFKMMKNIIFIYMLEKVKKYVKCFRWIMLF